MNPISPKTKRAGIVGALIAMGIVGAAVVTAPGMLKANTAITPPPMADQTFAAQLSFAGLVEAVSPAVVSIEVERAQRHLPTQGWSERPPMPEFFERYFGEEFSKRFQGPRQPMPHARGVGSGFIVDEAGYIVTNNHVIGDADLITVILDDGTRHEAEIVGRDRKTDLALLKIAADDPLPAVRFAEPGATRIGDWVVAIGNPFGLGKTATFGIVSARGRGIGSGPYDDFLQIDAPINRGNSGGPTFNLNGEVVGVNTAIFSPSGGNVGIGFAIPASMAESVVADLKADGRVTRGWLGVYIQSVTDDIADSLALDAEGGAIVAEVQPDSPAEAADLQQGDVIVSVNGTPIADTRALSRAIAAIPAGETAMLTVWRDGATIDLPATIGTADEPEIARADAPPTQVEGLGVRLAPLDRETRRAFNVESAVDGVVVTAVAPGSPAARKGVRPGDVIVTVANDPVRTAGEIESEVRAARADDRDAVLLLLNREGRERFVAVPLPRS